MNIQNIVKKLKAYNPQKIILFGSHAYGQPGPDSDFDIAIIKNTVEKYHDRLINVRRLVRTTQPIDFFVFTESEMEAKKNTNPLIQEILTKGKVIYGQG